MSAKRGQVKKEITLWRDDVDWYNEHYSSTPLSNVLTNLLHEFRVLHGTKSPKILMGEAAMQLKRTLENALNEQRS